MRKSRTSASNLSSVALKGSMYNFFSLFVLKFGGLIFTVILARMLLPELFGVFALALSISTLLLSFTDFGLENTFLRYLSESVGKGNKEKSKGIINYFFKKKLILVVIVMIVLALSSKFLSYNVYNKPLLFYPLIFSCLFIIAESFRTLFAIIFTTKKDVKSILFFDSSSQILKILFSLFAILVLSDKMVLSGIFIAFFLSSLLTFLLEYFILFKKDKKLLSAKPGYFNKDKINSYWKFMGLATILLSVFGSIDILMLGKFVSSEYLGYYRASLSLVMAISSLLALSTIFLPIFTQIEGKRFERGFYKTLRYLLIFSIPAALGTVFLSNYLIKLFYGNEYLLGTSTVYFLSIIILVSPLIGLYSTILQSKEKSKLISNSIIIALIFNILLNLVILIFFNKESLSTINLIAFSTSLSKLILLFLLIYHVKKTLKLNFKLNKIGGMLISVSAMSLFLFLFNKSVNMNLFLGIFEVVSGALIYILLLIMLRVLNKEDWGLLKNLIKNKKNE